ncbi:MAG TPA: vWA domain-containing protein [Pirellulales bacterium]
MDAAQNDQPAGVPPLACPAAPSERHGALVASLIFAPLVPLAWWVLLALAAAGLLLWYAIDSRRRLARTRWLAMLGLMTLAIAAPLALLLNPTWLERLPPPAGKPLVTILLDNSASMATPDGPRGVTRYAAGRQFALQLADDLGRRYEVRLETFAGQTSAADAQQLSAERPDGETTNLARSIREALDDDRPQGQALVLVSDGIDNVAGTAAVLASVQRSKALAAPIYTSTVGGSTAARDLDVELRSPQELAFVGQQVQVHVLLAQHGLAGARTRLKLSENGRSLESRDLVLSTKRDTEVTFDVSRKTPGLYRFEISADAAAGEVTAVNNRATLLLRVVDEPIRVLLLEGKPYWDSRFLVRTLAADPSLELVSLVRMTEDRVLEQTFGRSATGSTAPRAESWRIVHTEQGLPDTLQSLDQFQMIVLGRDTDVFLNDATVARLRKWVSATGGSLVCFRGAPESRVSQVLSPVLPVRWTPGRESRFHVRWTEAGKQLAWLSAAGEGSGDDALSQLPTLATASQRDDRKPLAVVLAAAAADGAAPGQPVITYQPFGSGRTVVVEGAGMWRWAFLAPQQQQHEQLYAALWQSLVRWLVSHAGLLPGEQRSLRPDKVCFSVNEPATATLLVSDAAARQEPPRIVLTKSDQPAAREFTPVASPDEPRMFRVVFGPLAEGRYEARIVGGAKEASGERTTFDVRRNLAERVELAARPDLMAKIAADSGGQVLRSADAGQVAQDFDAQFGRNRADRVRSETAWDRWWMLAAICLAWTTTWAVRRRGGLV